MTTQEFIKHVNKRFTRSRKCEITHDETSITFRSSCNHFDLWLFRLMRQLNVDFALGEFYNHEEHEVTLPLSLFTPVYKLTVYDDANAREKVMNHYPKGAALANTLKAMGFPKKATIVIEKTHII